MNKKQNKKKDKDPQYEDQYQRFRKLIQTIQKDIDDQYEQSKEKIADCEISMSKIADEIRMTATPRKGEMIREFLTLERKIEKEHSNALKEKKKELDKVRKGGSYERAQEKIDEIQAMRQETKKKIKDVLADLRKIIVEQDLKIQKLKEKWLIAKDTIFQHLIRPQELAVLNLDQHSEALKKQITTFAVGFQDIGPELKGKQREIQNFETDGITDDSSITVDSFLELRMLIFDSRIPTKFLPQLEKLIEEASDAENQSFTIYLDKPYPRGEGLRMFSTSKIKPQIVMSAIKESKE